MTDAFWPALAGFYAGVATVVLAGALARWWEVRRTVKLIEHHLQVAHAVLEQHQATAGLRAAKDREHVERFLRDLNAPHLPDNDPETWGV